MPEIEAERVICGILNLANADLTFAPRLVGKLHGSSTALAATHCELLMKAGKLEPVLRWGEVWYRRPGSGAKPGARICNPEPANSDWEKVTKRLATSATEGGA